MEWDGGEWNGEWKGGGMEGGEAAWSSIAAVFSGSGRSWFIEISTVNDPVIIRRYTLNSGSQFSAC